MGERNDAIVEDGNPLGETRRQRFRRGVRQALILAALMFASVSLYMVILWWRGPEATIETQMAWDAWIPFWPSWVWVYLIPYLIGPITVGCLRPSTFAWYIRSALLLDFVSLMIFALLPTRTVRPETTGLDQSWTADLYRNMITIDGPAANAAPSLHVSLTCLLAWALIRDFPRWWLVSCAGILTVWLSTLFTYQHHLIDVVTGALLAALIGLCCERPRMSCDSASQVA